MCKSLKRAYLGVFSMFGSREYLIRSRVGHLPLLIKLPVHVEEAKWTGTERGGDRFYIRTISFFNPAAAAPTARREARTGSVCVRLDTVCVAICTSALIGCSLYVHPLCPHWRMACAGFGSDVNHRQLSHTHPALIYNAAFDPLSTWEWCIIGLNLFRKWR